MTLILLAIIALMCCAALYFHRKHANALDEIKGILASTRREITKLKGKA